MYGAVSAGQGGVHASPACDSYGSTWWLLWEACSGLLAQGLALALLWYHFLHEPLEPLGCKKQRHVWFCESSGAFVDCFPLAAAAICVAVAQRQLLRKRIYYGLLRRGVILDFRSIERKLDPTLVVLALCLFCAVLHEIVFYDPKFKNGEDGMKVGIDDVFKVKVGGEDYKEKGRVFEIEMDDDTSKFLLSYCAPCIVFLIFLFSSHQIEPLLVPLSSYYIEDPEEAKRMLDGALILDEVDALSASADILAEQKPENVEAFYEALERHGRSLPRPPSGAAPNGASSWFSRISFRPWCHGLLCVPWPAPLLLEASLVDTASAAFFRMWRIMSVISTTFLLFVCAELAVGAWVSLQRQAWQSHAPATAWGSESNSGFITSAVIHALHLALALRVLQVTCFCCPLLGGRSCL